MRLVNRTSAAAACAVILLLFAGMGAPPSWPALLLVLWIPVAAAVAWRRSEAEGAVPGALIPAIVLAAACGLYLVSAATAQPVTFLLKWWPASASWSGIRHSGLFRFALLTAGGWWLWPHLRGRRLEWVVIGAALLAVGYCAIEFWRGTGGAALYRDDHPSFIFRFWAFARSLPSVAFYNPFWNGGRVESAGIAAGVPLLGTLFWPVWRFLPTHEVYTVVAFLALAGLIPLLGAGAARLAGGGRLAAAVAALLSLGSCELFFRWSLHFGTVPAVVAAGFVMPLCAVLVRVLREPFPRWRLAAVLAGALAGFLSWPPSLLMGWPVALAMLCSWRERSFRRVACLMAGGLGAALLLVPAWLGLFHRLQAASGLVAAAVSTPDWTHALAEGVRRLKEALVGANPLTVFLGIGGVLFWPDRVTRRIFGFTILGLLLLAGWGEMIKPQLQLTRAAIPLMLAAAIPAALWIERIGQDPGRRLRPVQASILALLILGAYATAALYRNRGTAPYGVLGEEPVKIAEWIQSQTPAESRIVFAGPTVHAYGRGHVAYLPVLAHRAMMACDYYHFSPYLREYEYPPAEFRGSPDDVRAFFDLYNVSAVFTFHDYWKRFFRKFPDRFEEAGAFGTEGRRVAFKIRRPPPGWFLVGSGSVEQRINELVVRPEAPGEKCVIRFHWANGLRPEPAVPIRPYDAGYNVRLIEMDPQGHREIRLRWSEWRRGVRFAEPPAEKTEEDHAPGRD